MPSQTAFTRASLADSGSPIRRAFSARDICSGASDCSPAASTSVSTCTGAGASVVVVERDLTVVVVAGSGAVSVESTTGWSKATGIGGTTDSRLARSLGPATPTTEIVASRIPSASSRTPSMPAMPKESPSRRGDSFASVSTLAPTGIDTIVPPAPLRSSTNSVSVVTSFASLTVASNAVGVRGMGSTEEFTLRPDDDPRIDRAPETTPIGSNTDAATLATSARLSSALWRDGIAVIGDQPRGRPHRDRAG